MKIAVLGCKWTTYDLLYDFEEYLGLSPTVVFSLPRAIADKNQVAGYAGEELVGLCDQRDWPLEMVSSYNLAEGEDTVRFRNWEIDLLIVIGWERLIPESVLESLQMFACGMHGSAYGLPRGRGRSPLNWALITHRTRFITSLFRYTPGIDDGDIIGSRTFEINLHDDIESLHLKNRISMSLLLKEYLPLIEHGVLNFVKQPPGQPSYYPRRRPQDSLIDWSSSSQGIYDLIRAVSPPYPPAFCSYGGSRMDIISAHPFDADLFPSSVIPGTIVERSITRDRLVVKTGDGSMLVRHFSGVPIERLTPGTRLMGGRRSAVLSDVFARYPSDLPSGQREVDWHTFGLPAPENDQ